MRKGNNLLASNALFVCLLAFAGIALSAAAQTTAPNEWTWMGGNSTISLLPDGLPSGQPGVYGTLGTPAPGDIPGSRTNTLTWTDGSGNFWLFGGLGYDSNDISGELNDLWKFNPATNLWTWMGGSSSVGSNGGQPGVYGTLGTPAAGNVPGGRSDAATWTDGAGNLWLFGGASYSSAGLYLLKDLWEFYPSTNEWAWMGGINLSGCGSSCSANGEYGTLGTPAAGNIPGGRENAVSWIDGKGNFWLFGGLGFDGAGTYGYLNDLWEFYPSTNEWAWMGGSSTMTCIYTQNGEECSPPGVYGTLGTPAAGNIPSGRAFAANWTDSSGNFWLFGGFCLASSEEGNVITSVYFNDLWEMNPSTNEWAWMAGSNTPCVSGSSSNPSAAISLAASLECTVRWGRRPRETSQEGATARQAGSTEAAIFGFLGALPLMLAEHPPTIPTIFGNSILPRTNGHGWAEAAVWTASPRWTGRNARRECMARWERLPQAIFREAVTAQRSGPIPPAIYGSLAAAESIQSAILAVSTISGNISHPQPHCRQR